VRLPDQLQVAGTSCGTDGIVSGSRLNTRSAAAKLSAAAPKRGKKPAWRAIALPRPA